MNTTKRLLAVYAIRRRLLDAYKQLQLTGDDEEHANAMHRACSQADHMINLTCHPPYIR